MTSQFDALAFLEGRSFVTAKSTRNPHQYIVRGKGNTNDEFDAIVRHVRQHGVKRGWGGKTYIVWYAPDGFHYWTMGWPVRETTILNRACSTTADQTYPFNERQPFSSHDRQLPEGVPE